jgi:formamidopyrimidine-DNA glycosylase
VPELPEVQAHAERLTECYAGVPLQAFRPLTFTALKTVSPDPAAALGQPLERVERRGKYLIAVFGPVAFVVHLMQGGRLREEPPGRHPAKPKLGQARWLFADDRAWLLTEAGTERRAGVWVVAAPVDTTGGPFAGLGPDAVEVGLDELTARLTATNQRLHGFLRDQGCIAGIGRMLANEICWRARLSPFASTARLGADGAAALHTAIGEACAEALAVERSRTDMSSAAERPGAVHGRVGRPCPRCGDTIGAVTYRTYTVAYCPTCQTGGKTLADNTTSKFLK